MKVAFVHYFSEELKHFSLPLLKRELLIKKHFAKKDYGSAVKELYIGLIAIAPQFEAFFKVKGPKYIKKEVNFLEYDVKLEYGKLINSSLEESKLLIFNTVLNSLPTLAKICSKLDFNLSEFERDLESFLRNDFYNMEDPLLENEHQDAYGEQSRALVESANPIKNQDQQITELNKFIDKNKFEEDQQIPYPGLSDKTSRKQLTELINQSAADFIKIVENVPLPEKFHQAIKEGLDRIDVLKYGVDSEEQDRIALYFEELMDIVRLPNSGGHLNIWRYGIDFNSL